MKYKIFKIENGREYPYSRDYSEDEFEVAQKLVNLLNRGRKKSDPYYHLSVIREIIRAD